MLSVIFEAATKYLNQLSFEKYLNHKLVYVSFAYLDTLYPKNVFTVLINTPYTIHIQ